MSVRLDRVLAALDGTGQHSSEGGCVPACAGWCARCVHFVPVEGGDLCAGCRAFLLGDSNDDPRRPTRTFRVGFETRTMRADGRVVHLNGDPRDNRPENLLVTDADAAMDRLRATLDPPADQLDRLHNLVVELGAHLAVPFAAAADGLTSVLNAYRERRTR